MKTMEQGFRSVTTLQWDNGHPSNLMVCNHTLTHTNNTVIPHLKLQIEPHCEWYLNWNSHQYSCVQSFRHSMNSSYKVITKYSFSLILMSKRCTLNIRPNILYPWPTDANSQMCTDVQFGRVETATFADATYNFQINWNKYSTIGGNAFLHFDVLYWNIDQVKETSLYLLNLNIYSFCEMYITVS